MLDCDLLKEAKALGIIFPTDQDLDWLTGGDPSPTGFEVDRRTNLLLRAKIDHWKSDKLAADWKYPDYA